ncbi:putative proteing [Gossypium arboreum]|uniref:Uncharacterized protein n=1 Tax=Gossypium arboreum TaxID=29729 RepID=A0A0B0MW70_GOSAR|nr:putative proteing [Gossypium arboreum]
MSGTWHRHLTLCLRLIEYPVVFQMVQQEIYGLCQNKRGYDHDVSDTDTYMKFMECVLDVWCMISKE